MTEAWLLSAAWIAYVALHSWFASLGFKRWFAARWPRLFPSYRLIYNAVATLLALPIAWLVFAVPSPTLWTWQGAWAWLMQGLGLLALAGFVWSARFYDGLTFLGLRRGHEGHIGSAEEPLVISPLHRFVRHPWYFLGLVLIWTRDMNLHWFITCVIATVYFIIGSRLEECKLELAYGERYARYRARVPGLFPLPWRYLDAAQARALQGKGGGAP